MRRINCRSLIMEVAQKELSPSDFRQFRRQFLLRPVMAMQAVDTVINNARVEGLVFTEGDEVFSIVDDLVRIIELITELFELIQSFFGRFQ